MGDWISLFLLVCLLIGKGLTQVLDCANPADIMFLLDGSDSIDAQEWEQEKDFVARMIMDLPITPSTINAGMVVYSSDIGEFYGLQPYKPGPLLRALAKGLNHPTGITTNTALGIQKVREIFNTQPAIRRGAPKIMIVITDGSSEDTMQTIQQANIAKSEGIRIISVGVGNNIFKEELKQIASNERKYYPVANWNALQKIEKDLRTMICKVIRTTRPPPVTLFPPTEPPYIPPPSDKICNVPGDIVFVIDGSDSIADSDFERLKTFVANLIDHFEIGTNAIHIGMIVYSSTIGDTVGLNPPLSKQLLKFRAQILGHPKFGTDTASGIEAARQMIRDQGRPTAPEIIVIITDGRSTSPGKTIMQAKLAKQDNIVMIPVGVGSEIFQDELNQIATDPRMVQNVADFRGLRNTVNTLRNLICKSIATTTTTMEPPTPPPEIPPPPEGFVCNVPADIVFLLDGSDSINARDWVRQKNFVNNMIRALEIGPRTIHVSIVVYSSNIGEMVPLTPFKSRGILILKTQALEQPKFGTDTALGIQKVREIIKTQGRPNAPRVAIVITDGKSTFPSNTILQANMAKADDITMIAVGVGSEVYMDELRQIASSRNKLFEVADFRSLQRIIVALRDLICQVIKTTTPAPIITTTTTTPAPSSTPQPMPLMICPQSRRSGDVMFLLDGYYGWDGYDWMMVTHFVSNLLDGLDITQDNIHVGVVVANQTRGDKVGLKPFRPRYQLKDFIHGFIKPDGEGDDAAALERVRLSFKRQGRPTSPQILIFVTNRPSKSMSQTIQQARLLKGDGVVIVSVGIGSRVRTEELRQMASPDGTFFRVQEIDALRYSLPGLQTIVCSLLGLTTTTTTTTTPAPPGLCDGCLIDKNVGFNPYPGDCTKYVQCWRVGGEVKSMIRSCPFGQFWDSDSITCRPSFLVNCLADPCRTAMEGFTYGMVEYGCRSFWKCREGKSVSHCCAIGSRYVDGLGCIDDASCTEKCPPDGGFAVPPPCDKKVHWDQRYYIEIIPGRGEIVRPCAPGTVYKERECRCEYGTGDLLPTTPGEICPPSAFYPFDSDLYDKSAQNVATGITNVQLTDLGTAFFNGHSEMNLWRFANAHWGSSLVIRFKYRFDYWNKFIDYGGLPVDLGADWKIGLSAWGNLTLGDMDLRIYRRLSNVYNLEDWRKLLRDFGQTREFYILLHQLGFKPGTSNTMQVIRVLGTPEAFAEMKLMLEKIRGMTLVNTGDLQNLIRQLGAMKGFINWRMIVNKLLGRIPTGSVDRTTEVKVTDVHGGHKIDNTGNVKVTDVHGGQETHTVVNASGIFTGPRQTTGGISWTVKKTGSTQVTGGTPGSTNVWQTGTNTWDRGLGGKTVTTGGGSSTTWQVTGKGTATRPDSVATDMNWERLLVEMQKELQKRNNVAQVGKGWNVMNKNFGVSGTGTWSSDVDNVNIPGMTSGSWAGVLSGSGGGLMGTGQVVMGTNTGQGYNAKSTSQKTTKVKIKDVTKTDGQVRTRIQKTAKEIVVTKPVEHKERVVVVQRGRTQTSGISGGMTGGTTGGDRTVTVVRKTKQTTGGRGGGTVRLTAQQQNNIKRILGEGVITATDLVNKPMPNITITNAKPQLKIREIIQEVVPMEFEITGGGTGGVRRTHTVTRKKTVVPSVGSGTTVRRIKILGSGEGSTSGGLRQTGGSTTTRQVGVIRTSTGDLDIHTLLSQLGGSGEFVDVRTLADSLKGVNIDTTKLFQGQRNGRINIGTLLKNLQSISQGGSVHISGSTGVGGGRGTIHRTVKTQTVPVGRVFVSGSGSESRLSSGGTGLGGASVVRRKVVNTPDGITALGSIGGSGGGVRRVVTRVGPSGVIPGVTGSQFFSSSSSGGGGTSRSGGSFISRTSSVGGSGGTGGSGGRFVVSSSGGGGGGASGSGRSFISRTSSVGGSGRTGGSGGRFVVSSSGRGGGTSGSGGSFFSRTSSSGGSSGGAGGSTGRFVVSSSGGGDGGAGGIISRRTLVRGAGGQSMPIGGRAFAGTGGSRNMMFLPPDSAENFLEMMTGGTKKRRRRSTQKQKSRTKRSINKREYQALVTNCQGRQGQQHPSIMIVGNEEDVQFGLKTYAYDQPALLSVPVVEGWNDVTLVYDGTKMTGIVQNWKGIAKNSVLLQGDIERRQSGLLVGACPGFASFHGEIDDLMVYHCVPGPIRELCERVIA